jgi:hypothetical protein
MRQRGKAMFEYEDDMTDAEWEKRENDMAAAWARCADEADSLKGAWEALFATLDERGLPFNSVAFRAACDTARGLIANAGQQPRREAT